MVDNGFVRLSRNSSKSMKTPTSKLLSAVKDNSILGTLHLPFRETASLHLGANFVASTTGNYASKQPADEYALTDLPMRAPNQFMRFCAGGCTCDM